MTKEQADAEKAMHPEMTFVEDSGRQLVIAGETGDLDAVLLGTLEVPGANALDCLLCHGSSLVTCPKAQTSSLRPVPEAPFGVATGVIREELDGQAA